MNDHERQCPDCYAAPAGQRRRPGDDAWAFDACSDCQRLGWVAHPRGIEGDELRQKLADGRGDIELIAEIVDKNADYSFDDWALIRFKRRYYLLSTSGCSCPDPKEVWTVAWGPGNIREFEAHLKSGAYDGYTVPGRQMDEFLEAVQKAKAS